MEAGASEFRLVLPALQKQAAAALPRLETIANLPVSFDRLVKRPEPGGQNTRSNRRLMRRSGGAPTQRLPCGGWAIPDVALKALQSDADPARRAWLIELLAPLGITTETLQRHAQDTTDSGVRQALLLAVGGEIRGQGLARQEQETLEVEFTKVLSRRS